MKSAATVHDRRWLHHGWGPTQGRLIFLMSSPRAGRKRAATVICMHENWLGSMIMEDPAIIV